MKTVLLLFCIILCFTARSQSRLIDSIITKESLVFSLSTLAHDSMRGRYTAMPETKHAADFIAERFKKAGLMELEGADGFFDYYPLKYQLGNDTTLVQAVNVVAALKGKESPDTIVIFCAHYDHIGIKRPLENADKDSIFNGANDNASGVALLIELAKYYAAIKLNRYTLVFIAFSGEELGLLGSAHMAFSIDQSYIHAVLNFDMIGRPLNSFTKKCMVIAERPKPVIKKLNAQLYPKNGFFMDDMYPMENMFTRSDHYSFTKVANRIFFTATSPIDKYYHTVKDEVSTIDFNFLLTATKNIAHCCRIFLQ